MGVRRGSTARMPAAVDALWAAARGRLRERWLYFLGDSSLRGLYVAFLQQLTWRVSNTEGMLMDTRVWPIGPRLQGNRTTWPTHGWLDVILEKRDDGSWKQLVVSEAVHLCPRPAGLKGCRSEHILSDIEPSHTLA